VVIPDQGWVITLDGPASSGKTTTARGVAERLGFVYLDTGALYRAVTVLALRAGLDAQDGAALGRFLASVRLRVKRDAAGQRVLDGEKDITAYLRSAEVDRQVSAVSAQSSVRTAMLGLQRAQRRRPGLVAEGRDLGTVVFPEAHLKIYLVADLDVRAERRALERQTRGEVYDVAAEAVALAARDQFDTNREAAPLAKPADAIVVDTSRLSIEGQIDRVVQLFRERCET
jgi:cytidylate kinase